MAQTIRTIKKYPNRRLYDTEISSYITLEEVRQLVLDGETFEVRDAKSGEDLTRSVLLQIISEHEEKGQPMLSPQLLSQIIRFYGDSLQGFMGPYLERSLQVFLDQQQQFRTQLNSLLGQTPWSMLNELTERNMDAWKSMQRGFLDRPLKLEPHLKPVVEPLYPRHGDFPFPVMFTSLAWSASVGICPASMCSSPFSTL